MIYNDKIEEYGYELLDNNDITKSNIKFNCKDELGYKYFIPYDRLRSNKKPLPFHISNPHSINNISNWLKVNKFNIGIVSDTYIKNDVDMKWKCSIHNIEFDKKWVEVQQGICCPKCSSDSLINHLTLNQDDVINDFKRIRNGFYSYEKTIYVKAKSKIIVTCPKHGDFLITPDKHKSGGICRQCSFEKLKILQVDTQGEVIKKFIEKHGDRYDYSKVNYSRSNKKVEVICKIHGSFMITPGHHINGSRGCPLCALDHTGWTKTKWIKAAEKSNRFDSYKVYILKCWSESETFYKIGRTFLKVDQRYGNLYHMPYNYSIVKIIKYDNGIDCYNAENKLLKAHHQNNLTYKPLIEFGGMYECFKELLV